MADPLLAAQHFLWLAVSVPLYDATLTGDDERYGVFPRPIASVVKNKTPPQPSKNFE